MSRNRSTEASLWDWMKRGTKSLARLDLRRIENGVEGGTPDVEGCLDGGQFWMELKCSTRTRDGRANVRFRPKQVPWLEKRQRCGGRAFVLVQVGKGGAACRYLIPGRDARTVDGDVPEAWLRALSLVPPTADAGVILETAAKGW